MMKLDTVYFKEPLIWFCQFKVARISIELEGSFK